MATGANIQNNRGIQVSNITPEADLRDGSAEMWQAAGRTFDRLAEAAKPDLIRRAQARGMAEGVAVANGEAMPERGLLFFGDVAQARTAALETAFTARTRQDIDAREQEIRREHRYDPEAYQARMGEVVSGFIQGAPPDFAVEVEAYAQGKASEGLGWVSGQRSARDEAEVNQALTVRVQTLDDRLLALASQPGGMDTPEYAAALTERQELQDNRMSNPAILYSEDQRLADDDKLDAAVLGANVSRLAVQAFTDNGRGLPGKAAATRFLQEEVLNGEAFADLTPEARERIYRGGLRDINDYYAVDREEARVQAEQEREATAARREAVGDYRLRIVLGEDVRATVLADETLDESDKAALLTTIQAADRREAAQARTDAALERAESRDIYNGFRDEAAAGTLTPADLADAVSSGLISRGQARTLGAQNDRSLGPVINDVMAPVRDQARRPGMEGRASAANMAIAEEAAAIWARANPYATLDQRLIAGRVIGERVFGGQREGAPTTRQGAAQQQTQQLEALASERQRRARSGNPMSTADYNRRRNEIIHGR